MPRIRLEEKMAIRNTAMGGTDWAGNEVFKAVDQNDTLNALAGLNGFWAWTIDFSTFDGTSTWLDHYMRSKNDNTIESGYAETLTHGHVWPISSVDGSAASATEGIYTDPANMTVTPRRVYVGAKSIFVIVAGIPKNSCIFLTSAIGGAYSGSFSLGNDDRYLWSTQTIGSIGTTGGTTTHVSHSLNQNSNVGAAAGGVELTNNGIAAYTNNYNYVNFYLYKSTATYDSTRDFLPVGTYLIFRGTAPDIPANYAFQTDRGEGIMIFKNSSLNTEDGTEIHSHAVTMTTTRTHQTSYCIPNYHKNDSQTATSTASHMPQYIMVGFIKKIS